LLNLVKSVCFRNINSLLIITKSEKIKIVQTDDQNPIEIEEDLKRCLVHRIDKKYLSDYLSASLNDIETFKNSQIYVIELRIQPKTNYYMLRFNYDNTKRFEILINTFELNKAPNERNQTVNMTIENKSISENLSHKGNLNEDPAKKDSIMYLIRDNNVKNPSENQGGAQKPQKNSVFNLNENKSNNIFNNNITEEDEKAKKNHVNNKNINLNNSDNLEEFPDDEFLHEAIMKEQKKDLEKKMTEDESNIKLKKSAIPSANEFAQKLEEVFYFSIQKAEYAFKLSKSGLEYTAKSNEKSSNEKWGLINTSDITEFKILSESENNNTYDVLFTFALKKIIFLDKKTLFILRVLIKKHLTFLRKN